MTSRDALTHFPPTHTEALARLARFVPLAGRDYAARRNYDLGPGRHDGVSTLSPYLRHRLLTEEDVLGAVLGRHAPSSAQKFVQEVFWRTYWKGWLEMRPAVWEAYKATLHRDWNAVQTQSGLRQSWEDACKGETGIAPFDHWARELVQTGYLHNHARMWFASIWIFTLRLPWALGADFFLRHLLDGDPASNTLSWRWVAGLQTKGKTYLARPSNIARYTEGRFDPKGELATEAPALDGPPHPDRQAPPVSGGFDPELPTVLLLHEDDLSPAWLFDLGLRPRATAFLSPQAIPSPVSAAPHVAAFRSVAMRDVADRWQTRMGDITMDLGTGPATTAWADRFDASQIVTPWAPVGWLNDALSDAPDPRLTRLIRPYDARAWPHATAGFFKFKEKIPTLLGAMRGIADA